MIFRLRLPAALARVALKRAGTTRRLTDVLVEALANDTIFADLMARTDPVNHDPRPRPRLGGSWDER
jgi:hypothetical protein